MTGTLEAFADERVAVYLGDCRDLLRILPADSVDAVVTDPPYELGFMGRSWDSLGIAYDNNVWAEALRVLRPGGYLLAFGGSRTWHRLACAIEDAGFELRDSIAWMYGSGFPKSLDVSKAIDKAAGAERSVVGSKLDLPGYGTRNGLGNHANLNDDRWSGVGVEHGGMAITAPATNDARRWQGWGTALKPAFEPIVVARKPLVGTVAANVLAYGTGGINVDGCRVKTTESTKRANVAPRFNGNSYANGDTYAPEPWTSGSDAGRWPTNVVLTHQPLLDDNGRVIGDACANGCMPGCPVAELDAQGGQRPSRSYGPRAGAKGNGWRMTASGSEYDDNGGGASRFFPTFRYQAKAPAKERPKVDGVSHPTVKPLELMRWLVRLVTPPGGLVVDPFAGSGTTLAAAVLEGLRAIGAEQEATHLPLIRVRMEHLPEVEKAA